MSIGNKFERAAKKVIKERDLPPSYGALLLLFDAQKIESDFDTSLYGKKAYELLFKHIRLADLYPAEYYPQFFSGDLKGELGDFWVIAIEGFIQNERAISKLTDAINLSALSDYVAGITFENFLHFYQLPFVYDCRLSQGHDPHDSSYLAYCLIKEDENNMASRAFKMIFGDTFVEEEASIQKQDLWIELDTKMG